MTGTDRLMITLTIAIAVAANLIIWGSVLRRARHPQPAAPRHTPKHASTERIHAGGRYLATQPRRYSPPLTEQAIITQRPGRPWDTAAQPKLAGAYECCECCDDCGQPHEDPCEGGCNDPAPLTDAATLAMYRGDWGTMPAERIIAAEQLAKGLIA